MTLKKSRSMMFGKVASCITGVILLSLSATANAINGNEMPNGDMVSVPEPSSLILMGIGLAALGFVRRRK